MEHFNLSDCRVLWGYGPLPTPAFPFFAPTQHALDEGPNQNIRTAFRVGYLKGQKDYNVTRIQEKRIWRRVGINLGISSMGSGLGVWC